MKDKSDSALSIAFVASDTEEAQAALARLQARYDSVDPGSANVILALGGDGFMLETLHRWMGHPVAIYGMNCGTVGFLMNQYDEEDLPEVLVRAHSVTLNPLLMTARTKDGKEVRAHAVNEVALLRESRQAAKIAITVDNIVRMPELVCDGVLISTPAGSTAYNLSAHGPIVPLGSKLLALTPISAFRPRRWRGALLPETAETRFDILEATKRPVRAEADFAEVPDVVEVHVRTDPDIAMTLLFNPEHNLEERILREQFEP
jgi:NAD+ kinase